MRDTAPGPPLPETTRPHLVAAASARMPGLDGLRGLAILLVLIFHFIGQREADGWGRYLVLVSNAGWCGVDLFFVLSGFLITGILYDSRTSKRYFLAFYARRLLRIFPLYYGLLILLCIVAPRIHLLPQAYAQYLGKYQLWYWTYNMNYLFARVGWGHSLDHLWSLAVEEQFYLVWPFIVRFTGRKRLIPLCAACVLASLTLRVLLHGLNVSTCAIYVITPARMDGLAIGALVALLVRSPRAFPLLTRYARPVAICTTISLVVAFAMFLPHAEFKPFMQTVGFTLLACWSGSLLVLALTLPETSLLGGFFHSRVMVSLGKYSYALYVFHYMIVATLVRHFPFGWLRSVTHSDIPGLLLFFAWASVVAIVLALASWHGIEKRFLAMRRYFA